MNISAKGPLTISCSPSNVFDRIIIENLGLRAILSAGIGEHDYEDRIFSARITLPKVESREYEALIFNFLVIENSEHITLKLNSKALTLLIFVYPRKFRPYVNRIEEDLELVLSQSDLLPKNTSELLNEDQIQLFINKIRSTVLSFENESLLNYEEFEMIHFYDEQTMQISSEFFFDNLLEYDEG